MPYWLGAGLWGATVTTVAMTALVCVVGGWVCGYAHRSLLEWVRVRNPLRMLARAYAELWEDIWYLIETGRFRPGRLAKLGGSGRIQGRKIAGCGARPQG